MANRPVQKGGTVLQQSCANVMNGQRPSTSPRWAGGLDRMTGHTENLMPTVTIRCAGEVRARGGEGDRRRRFREPQTMPS